MSLPIDARPYVNRGFGNVQVNHLRRFLSGAGYADMQFVLPGPHPVVVAERDKNA